MTALGAIVDIIPRQLTIAELLAELEAEQPPEPSGIEAICQACGVFRYCIYRQVWEVGTGLERYCPYLRTKLNGG